MAPGGDPPPGSGDKPPGLTVYKTLDDLLKADKDAKKKGFDTEYVLAVYKSDD